MVAGNPNGTMTVLVVGLTFLSVQLLICTGDLLSSVSAAAVGAPRAPADACLYYDAASKSTFDLSPLQLSPTSSYSVHDVFDTRERNYTYVFNVCAPAAQPVPNCGKQNSSANANVAAYQVSNSNNNCHNLNSGYTDSKWSLIDPTDATKGVALTYQNGDPCGGGGVRRELVLWFQCADVYANQPSTRVTEPETCHYELAFETVFGCPLECPFSNRKLCGGHGVCGIDTDAGTPRCFCDSLHTGPDCSQAPESVSAKCDGVCVALAILVVLLSILLVVSCVIFFRVQKLETMNMRFTALSDTFVPPVGQSASDRIHSKHPAPIRINSC